MRSFFTLFLLLAPFFALADAGFNITRAKAPCYAVFKNIDKLSDYEFFKISANDERRGKDIVLDSSHRLKENDSLQIYYTEGRKYWQGPIKIVIRHIATQQFVDSFTLIAEGQNLGITFTGVENNKVKYTVDKSKAEYPYSLYGNEEVDGASAIRNKYILISMSAIGFLLLLFMMFKRRKSNSINKTA